MKYEYTVSIYCRNDGDKLHRFVSSIYGQNPGVTVEVIIANDASTDGSRAAAEDCAAEFPGVRVVSYGVAAGYACCHNRVLGMAAGTYFAAAGPDMIFAEPGWLSGLSAGFKSDGRLAVRGIAGTPCGIDENGDAVTGTERIEYAGGPCIMLNTALAKRYGLFSPETQSRPFAQMDLSLRYRQMGCDVSHAAIEYAAQSVQPSVQNASSHPYHADRRRFMLRWGVYLRTRRFTNRLLVVTGNATGMGDLLCVTPALRRLRAAHPTAEIVVETSVQELFAGNGNVDRVTPPGGAGNRDDGAWDCVLYPGVSMYYHGRNSLPGKLAYDMGLVPDSDRLDFALDTEGTPAVLKEFGLEEGRYVVVSLISGHDKQSWEGRSLSPDAGRTVCRAVMEMGYTAVQVGGGQEDLMPAGDGFVSLVDRTDIGQLAHVLRGGRCAVAVDSFPFHLAQAIGVRTLGIFGATLPECRITDYSTVELARHPGLDCMGCYMRKPEGGFNTCLRGDVACMSEIPEGYITRKVAGIVDGDGPAVPAEFLDIIGRSSRMAEESEAMNQDIMASYGALKDMFMATPLRLARALEKFGPLRPIARAIKVALKRRLARTGQN